MFTSTDEFIFSLFSKVERVSADVKWSGRLYQMCGQATLNGQSQRAEIKDQVTFETSCPRSVNTSIKCQMQN